MLMRFYFGLKPLHLFIFGNFHNRHTIVEHDWVMFMTHRLISSSMRNKLIFYYLNIVVQ